MARQSAIWVCPALCGCKIRMTAAWAEPPVNGESFRHPVPQRAAFSGDEGNQIDVHEIVAVCVQHDSLRTAPFPPDPYYGSPGYIRPIPASPTEAERLYIHLFKYSGQRATPSTCSCRYYEHHDRSGVEPSDIKWHGKHSRKCSLHQNDDDKHTRAREENGRRNSIIVQAASILGIDMADTTPAMRNRFNRLAASWSYVDLGTSRVLHVRLSDNSATQQQRNTAQAWCDTNLGAGKVVIE